MAARDQGVRRLVWYWGFLNKVSFHEPETQVQTKTTELKQEPIQPMKQFSNNSTQLRFNINHQKQRDIRNEISSHGTLVHPSSTLGPLLDEHIVDHQLIGKLHSL